MERPFFAYQGRASELSGARSLVTISGDEEVIIENCRRILECNEIKCSVSSRGFLVDIWGSDLTLTSFSSGSVSVNGKIRSVSIEKRSSRGGKE